jgi:hypothetical protein
MIKFYQKFVSISDIKYRPGSLSKLGYKDYKI